MALPFFLQDSIDLFLGNYSVDESDGPTPLRAQKDWKFLTVSKHSSHLKLECAVSASEVGGGLFIYHPVRPLRTEEVTCIVPLSLAVAYRHGDSLLYVHHQLPTGW